LANAEGLEILRELAAFREAHCQEAVTARVVVKFDSLSLCERAGVRALAQIATHNVAAGFSPEFVAEFAKH
jgi:hypothetical protein